MTFLARRLAVGTTGGAGERVTTFLRGSGGAGERVKTGGDDLVDAVVAGGWSKWRAGNARLLLIPPARSAAAPVFGARSAAGPASAPRRSPPRRFRAASAPPSPAQRRLSPRRRRPPLIEATGLAYRLSALNRA